MRRIVDGFLGGLLLVGLACLLYAAHQDGTFLVSTAPSGTASRPPSLAVTGTATATNTATSLPTMTLTAPPTPSSTPTPSATPTPETTLQQSPSPSEIAVAQP